MQQEGVEIGPLQAVSRTYSFHFLIRSTVDTKFQVVLLYRIRLSVVVAVTALRTGETGGRTGPAILRGPQKYAGKFLTDNPNSLLECHNLFLFVFQHMRFLDNVSGSTDTVTLFICL